MTDIPAQLRAWRRAYQIISESIPWESPDLELVTRTAILLLVGYMQQDGESLFGLESDLDVEMQIITTYADYDARTNLAIAWGMAQSI